MRTDPRPRSPRAARPGALVAACAAALLVPAVAGPAAADATPDAEPWCAAEELDRPVDVYTSNAVDDPGVGIYAGGDLVVSTATELEGQVVVGGDADFSAAPTLNVGSAGGGGSAITPAGGTDMLLVGGDLVTGPNLQVGFHTAGGGSVVVGGTVRGTVDTAPFAGPSLGTVTEGVGARAALANHAGVPALLTEIAGDAAAGAARAEVVGGTLTLDGAGSYVVDGRDVSDLTTLRVTTGGAPVTLTVTGADVSLDRLAHVEVDGTRVYQATQHLSRALLWSFPDADAVHLGTNDQFPGSVVLPREESTLTLATSTNGRILAAGDVAYTGGAGIEHHNYPWTGECTPQGDTPETDEPATDQPATDEPATDEPADENPATPDVPDDTATGDTPADGAGPDDAAAGDEVAVTAGAPADADASALAESAVEDAAGTAETVAAGTAELPRTGANVGLLAAAATVLLGGGLGLLALRRRATR